MPSGKAILLIFIVMFVISFAAWYLSPIGDWIKVNILRQRDKLQTKLKVKKKDEKTILY
jgi:hypothetical protein